MLAKLLSASLHGIEAILTTVEVFVTKGIGYQITGLPDESIKESLSRIAIAFTQSGYHMPRTKLSIHLGPANIRKSGSALDLPIALGILIATEQITAINNTHQLIIAGELSLDGNIQPIEGALLMSELCLRKSCAGIIIPAGNMPEASLIHETPIYAVQTLNKAISVLTTNTQPTIITKQPITPINYTEDFSSVIGQHSAKRAMEIAAAGGHHVLMSGFPGTGKSLLAKCLPSILPPMSRREMLETTKIRSVLEKITLPHFVQERPFRQIHHTISLAGLIGGGKFALPGEITLAHNGVLFMDEFTEFASTLLEALREPLEEKSIQVSRSGISLQYPANFMLIAAMNPCACGFRGHPTKKCTCSKRAIWWHHRKLSGPILDRFDISVTSEIIEAREIFIKPEGVETSASIRERVRLARLKQWQRYQQEKRIHTNAQLSHELINKYCQVDEHTKRFISRSWEKNNLSMRGLDKILKVARTIADLNNSDHIELAHVAEALSFKCTSIHDAADHSSNKNKGGSHLYPV